MECVFFFSDAIRDDLGRANVCVCVCVCAETGNIPKTAMMVSETYVLISKPKKRIKYTHTHTQCVSSRGCCCTQTFRRLLLLPTTVNFLCTQTYCRTQRDKKIKNWRPEAWSCHSEKDIRIHPTASFFLFALQGLACYILHGVRKRKKKNRQKDTTHIKKKM